MSEVTTEKLVADFKVLIDDVEELIKATASQPGALVAELCERLERKIVEARRALAEGEQALRERAAQARARTESYLSRNLWSTVAIAAGIGLLFGLLQRRDRRCVGAPPIQCARKNADQAA
jgi:ElaB/YqjD/DUF883 family membrane-anchored ribosome-binding protein